MPVEAEPLILIYETQKFKTILANFGTILCYYGSLRSVGNPACMLNRGG